jgi:16S rRNA processing protein RimM
MTEANGCTGKRIVVGRISSVYGIKGWVKVISYTEPKENLQDYRPWWIEDSSGQARQLEVDECRRQGQGLIAHIKGIDDRDEARGFCQKDILVEVDLLPPLGTGEYYWYQLQGLQVFGGTFDNQLLLGRVERLLETGANDVLVVAPGDGSVDDRERLVPFVPGQYGTEVDLEAGCIRLEWDPEF